MRHPDWRVRLAAYVTANVRRPARPGRFDCALFAVGARAAVTGTNLLTGHEQARYRTFEEGLELLRAGGFADHVAWVTQGLEEIAPAFAQVGDLAALDGTDGYVALGVVQGEGVYVLDPGARGLGVVPLTEVRRAWRT